MRTVFNMAGTAGALSALYYLYQRQLGAISFFILSIYFFYLARKMLSKSDLEEKNHMPDGNSGEKTGKNNRLS
ncbi:hypothetical protein [Mesobacillus zeae]|uniref:Uncharacterized protein n=1 Tax=Mesobacillus zeae TaxID=1917180 RepID=A0A398BH52_9BACI|nr:hypothetical protein [Mesobacillus zeae]RID86876.1 hypothetical protein D1970_06390 [Mesobacillus zeae]